jgi:hypothetical protein
MLTIPDLVRGGPKSIDTKQGVTHCRLSLRESTFFRGAKDDYVRQRLVALAAGGKITRLSCFEGIRRR